MISFERLVKPLIDIKRGEWSKVLLTFLYFYLTITAYYILKPARNSLYIHFLGANRLPYVVMFIAITSLVVIAIYTWCAKKFDNIRAVSGFLILSIVLLFFFRWGLTLDSDQYIAGVFSFCFYVWLTLFNSITVMQFWVLANDVFDAQAAKRLYGIVGTGGILGGLTGSIIAMQAKKLGTENLLLVSALYVLLMLLIYNVIWFREKKNFINESHDMVDKKKFSTKESFKIVKHSKYLLYVLLIVALIKFVTVQTEWQFHKFSEIFVDGLDDKTAFFGKIFASLNIIALVIQMIFTSKVMKKFNFFGALLPLPFGLLMGAGAIVFFPVLKAAAILKISDGSLRYSINQTATNFLYLPVNRQVRYKIKPFIDVCGYQFAKGFGSLFIMGYLFFVSTFFTAGPIEQAQWLSYANIVFLFIWFIVIIAIKKEYPNEIRMYLKDSCLLDNADNNKFLFQSTLTKNYKEVLQEYNDLLDDTHFNSFNIRLAVCVALYEAGMEKDGIKTLLEEIVKEDNLLEIDMHEDYQKTVDNLLENLAKKNDGHDRYDAIKALNKLKRKNLKLAFDEERIKEEVDQEIKDYYKTFAILFLYESLIRKNDLDEFKTDNHYVIIHNMLLQIIERIFRLLGLLYNSLDMHMIYHGILNKNIYVRSNALELLNEIVHGDFKRRLFLLLDGELSIFGPERAMSFSPKMKVDSINVLRESINGENTWLALGAMFMVFKFKIKELYDAVSSVVGSECKLLKQGASFICRKIREEKMGGQDD